LPSDLVGVADNVAAAAPRERPVAWIHWAPDTGVVIVMAEAIDQQADAKGEQ
jgi:fructose-specific component phosphotransferase system IIB-like protein